jgi:phenylpropionate dioxygenase-like ring-hydroxylating dioxygenase large terminal subunit
MVMSAEQQALLTQTGPGTPMGEVFRRYWLPACLSERVPEPDCPPVAIKLLSQRLVVFRDAQGQVGILDEACPHRGASLAYGLCENGTLTCVYHGWKFDVRGCVVEAPGELRPTEFGKNIPPVGYPVHEAGGLIWIYMGPTGTAPPFPKWRFCDMDPGDLLAVHYLQSTNYLQAVEGDIDAVHASYLHLDRKKFNERHQTKAEGIDFAPIFGFDRAPRGRVFHEDWGVDSVWQMAVEDPEHPGEAHPGLIGYLVHPFIMPVSSIVAGGALGPYIWHAFVPVDDEHHLVYYVHYDPDQAMTPEVRQDVIRYFGHRFDEQYRPLGNLDNRHFQDRTLQREGWLTGVDGIAAQDIMINQSCGTLVDRTKEHLGAEDVGVVAVRKCLFRAIEAVQAGQDPPRVEPEVYAALDGYAAIVPRGTEWKDVKHGSAHDPAVDLSPVRS